MVARQIYPEYSNLECLRAAHRLPVVKKSIYSAEQSEFLMLLRSKRQKAGLSQVGLAQKLGRSQSFVSKYESGELRLDLLQLRDICQALGTTLSKFVREFEGRLS
jgi:ribosome-binding protein aMBF1 (putative translation factor)